MIWEEVEKKYGKELADKMRKSQFLRGITVSLREDGNVDIPEEDIERAYRDVMGKHVSSFGWD